MRTWLFVLATGCVGCSALQRDKVPGDELGSYHVIANLETSTCGPGALGSTDLWEFDVKLSKDGHDLYWLNGAEAIPGSLAADGVSFAFDSQVVVQAIAPGKGRPGCTIARTDSGSGQLSSPSAPVDAFAGTLRYGFQAVQGSDCQELMGVPGGFYALPCEMSYKMSANRKN
jgi:hypothetical protein